ncbi:MAG: HD-GYP domain-containing protein [Candidatus Omnitrophota bacterium]
MDPGSKRHLSWNKIESELLSRVFPKRGLSPRGPDLPSVLRQPKRIGYQTALEDASRDVMRFRRLKYLLRRMVRVIDRQVGVAHTGILLFEEGSGSYALFDSANRKDAGGSAGYVRVSPKNALISVFGGEKSPLLDATGTLTSYNVMSMLNDEGFLAKHPGTAKNLKKVKRQMDLLQADICIPSYFRKRLLGVLILGEKLSGERFKQEEIDFFHRLVNGTAAAISSAQLIENLQAKVKRVESLYEKSHRLFIHTSIALATAIDARDPYTHGHTERVTGYALAISNEMKDSGEVKDVSDFTESLHISALLHDIGKIGIPDHILNKRGSLTQEEYEKIKEHPTIGATILYPIRELGDILDGVRSHQEKYDGTGYPDGFKGKQIPLLARVISVADAFDAITTTRPYRTKKSIETAVDEVKHYAGRQFDPDIVDAFLAAYRKKKLFNHVF